jgi:hypothetical protein
MVSDLRIETERALFFRRLYKVQLLCWSKRLGSQGVPRKGIGLEQARIEAETYGLEMPARRSRSVSLRRGLQYSNACAVAPGASAVRNSVPEPPLATIPPR